MAVNNSNDLFCRSCGVKRQERMNFCQSCGSSYISGEIKQNANSFPKTNAQGKNRLISMLMTFINPGVVIKSRMASFSWPWALSVSGLAFMLFFLQTGLDLLRYKKISVIGVAGLTVTGLIFGTIGVAILAVISWQVSRMFGCQQSSGWTIRAFGLGYSPTLFYALLGVIANVALGWNTSVAFGITGVLWAMGPMVSTIKEMVGGRLLISAVIASICGTVMLFGWALIST